MDEELLKKRNIEGLAYLIFLQERTQKEALEYIYNKDYSNINITPFKKARNNLMDQGFIKSNNALRNAKFKSVIDPFIKFVGRKKDLTEKEIAGLKVLLTSKWFKNLFSFDVLEYAPEIGRDDKEILRFRYNSKGAFHTLGLILDDLTCFTSNRRTHFSIMPEFVEGTEPLSSYALEDLSSYSSFDQFLKEENQKRIKKYDKIMETLKPNIKERVRERERPWYDNFINELYKKELMFNLPDLSKITTLYHLNSGVWVTTKNFFKNPIGQL